MVVAFRRNAKDKLKRKYCLRTEVLTSLRLYVPHWQSIGDGQATGTACILAGFYNRRSPISVGMFGQIHEQVGLAPAFSFLFVHGSFRIV
jgi:hypothetical protein